MRTSLPFIDFKPESFIPRRFAPLIATVVDESVDAFVKKCGFSFADLLATVGATCLAAPLRITGKYLLQTGLEVFEELLAKDVREFSAPFLTEEFEETGNIARDGSDFPTLVHPPIEFGPRALPWFQGFVFRLMETVMFSDFEFFDLPCCIFYATTVTAPRKTAEEVRAELEIPEWMEEFMDDVPVVCILVSDALVRAPQDDDVKGVSGFSYVISTAVRSGLSDSKERLDPALLERMFGLDLDVMKDPNLGKFISSNDINNITKMLTQVQEVLMRMLRKKEEALAAEIGKFSGLKYRLFRGNQPEATTKYKGVLYKKIVYLQHASLCMVLQKYPDAQKDFKAFAGSLEFNELPEVKSRAIFYSALCFFRQPGYSIADFTQQIESVCGSTLTEQKVTCPRTALLIPLLAMELLHWRWSIGGLARRDRQEALRIPKHAMAIVRMKWPQKTRVLVQALLYERTASLLFGHRTAALYLAESGMKYHELNLHGHVLRVLKWLMQLLPQVSWRLLRQQVWLEKVGTLKALKYDQRSLLSCRDLLALPDLCPSLQERVLAMFWYPFNLPSVAAASRHMKMRNLVEIQKVHLISCMQPQYYGFSQKDFVGLTKAYDKWFTANISRSSSISFDEIWEQSESEEPITGDLQVPCDTVVKIVVGLSNRFTFAVHLDETSVKIQYNGGEEEDYELKKLSHIEVPSLTKKPMYITYDLVPRSEGKYTITEFEKSYWGYVESSMKCEPLSFVAVRDFPKVTMTAEDLPDAAFQDSCQDFYVFVENTGSTVINEFRIAFDHPELILYHGEYDYKVGTKLVIVKVCKTLEPGANISVPLIFKAPYESKITIHGFVDVAGNKAAYLVKEIRTIPVVEVVSEISPLSNANNDYMIKCNVKALADQIELYGIINNKGEKLRMLAFSEAPVLNIGDSIQLVSLMKNPEERREVEKWRQTKRQSFSLLYTIQSNELMSQRELEISTETTAPDYKLEMPAEVSCKVGEIVWCSVTVEGDGKPVFLEPLPFTPVESPTTNVNGCRFVGKIRLQLSKTNNYKASFSFVVLAAGIYKFTGFKVSNTPNFQQAKHVSVTQRLSVSITNK